MLNNNSVSTPANINTSKDLQIKAVLEPIPDLKIDLTASRTDTRAKSVQYMYDGMPTTLSGSFNMTTISLRGALAGMGNADNGYRSAAFDHFRLVQVIRSISSLRLPDCSPTGVSVMVVCLSYLGYRII